MLEAPNSELRAFEEVVQSKFEESPTYAIQTSKENKRKRVFKIERGLFAWLISFQPELNQEEEIII